MITPNYTYSIVAAFCAVVLISGCSESSTEPDNEITTEEAIFTTENAAMAEEEFVSIFEYTDDEASASESTSGKQSATAAQQVQSTENIPDCATVTRNQQNQTLVIDFGDECECNDGLTRSGQIVIDLDGAFRLAGTTTSITLQDYSVENIAIEGSMKITYNGEDEGYIWEVSGAELHMDNGTFIWSGIKTIKRTSGAGTFRPYDDEYEMTGFGEGTNRQDVDFSIEITSPLLKKRGSVACRRNIVEGVVEYNIGSRELILDYGDGSCDRRATLTIDGQSREIILR